MLKKIFLVFTILCLLPCLLFAQKGKLRGVVTDKETGDPLVGANVIIEGTNMGAAADLNGEFIVLGVPPGLYSVRTEYIGYQRTTISNIRISSNITTTLDFQLASAALNMDAVLIVAERPIVQRNTTNTVRMTTQEDLANIPIRGLQNIIGINAGVVQQDGDIHIRGGRSNEVAYFIDGATATNPYDNEENLSVIQEAIEELQMQAGGFTAEYGGANSGVVVTTVRTGGPTLRGSLDYRSDDFVSGGDEFFGTTSQGYHNVVGTLSGTVPYLSKMRFFIATQYNYMRNRNNALLEPFSFENLVDDGLEGRSKGDSLPGPLNFERNFLPNNDRRDVDFNGTLVYNLSSSFKFKLTGSYSYLRYPNGWNSFSNALGNYYSNTESRTVSKRGLVSLRTTHLINPSTFYDLSLSWSTSNYKNFDPRFGDDWLKYADRNEWGAAGLDTSQWQSAFRGPLVYSTIWNFQFTPPNSPKNSYSKRNQNSIGASLDFSSQVTKNIELKFGGRIDRWSMRNFSVGSVRNYLAYLYGTDGQSERGFESDYIRRIELGNKGGIDYYGWDVDGLKKINDGPNGPRKPIFASLYGQTKVEYRDLIINFGLRYERYDIKAPRPADLEDPERDMVNRWIDEDALVYTEPYTYLLPRLNFAFPVTDQTVFYAQYGNYIQYKNLSNIYQGGITDWARQVLPESRNLRGTEARFLAKPEQNTQYELGLRQAITDNFAFTFTLFYRDYLDLVRGGQILSDGTGDIPEGQMFMGGYVNDDVATTKGLELTLDLRRTKRLSARVNYTLANTRGTGSDERSTRVATSDVNFGKYPLFITNLDYNQPHRGSIILDYRFARRDGGKYLQGFGINTLFTFNSGHSYTKIREPIHLGQSTPWNVGVRALADTRQRHATEVINSSLTPWNFNLDLTIDKMFYFNMFNLKLYANILNALNSRNIINVYNTTGTDDDDGWLKTSQAVSYINSPGYLDFYKAINLDNRWHYLGATGNDLWSSPRVIRFGLTFEFK